MLRQRRAIIDWFLVAVAGAIGFFGVCASFAQAQPTGAAANTPASVQMGPILTEQLPVMSITEPETQSKATRMYQRAIREMHQGKAASAEKDADRAVKLDPKFADAEALAATGALMQRQFSRARDEAGKAVRIDPNDEKAWVILATADNYLGKYADAAYALNHLEHQNQATWQAAYQLARAEAGQEHAAEALEWANRAALTAPADFAPLHLLRASALLAANQNLQAADELEIYLQLLSKTAPQRAELTRELQQLRELQESDAASPASEAVPGYNALAN